jgi:hypothetical protein
MLPGRNAAGTRDLKDVFGSSVLRRPDRRPEADLDDLLLGRPLFVSAFRRRGRRFKQGRLVLELTAPEPVIWRPYRPFRSYGARTSLAQPYSIQSVGPVTGPGGWAIKRDLFRMITVLGASDLWELAVPTIDVELVRTALETATSSGGSDG